MVLVAELFLAERVWAWGPAVHTVLACRILDNAASLLPNIAAIIQTYYLEYIYGNLAADFFIGRLQKESTCHSHDWETGFRFLRQVRCEKEAAYAYGFLSHLAADVVAHNYFIPDTIYRITFPKRMSHLYAEMMVDNSMEAIYIRTAKDILSMKKLSCDGLLKKTIPDTRKTIKARRHIFIQSVRFSDSISCSPTISFLTKGSTIQISKKIRDFMIQLSYSLIMDVLNDPVSSQCFSFDPVGKDNLRLANRYGLLSKILNLPHPKLRFKIDRRLLRLLVRNEHNKNP
jgi:hypothetical protein